MQVESNNHFYNKSFDFVTVPNVLNAFGHIKLDNFLDKNLLLYTFCFSLIFCLLRYKVNLVKPI